MRLTKKQKEVLNFIALLASGLCLATIGGLLYIVLCLY